MRRSLLLVPLALAVALAYAAVAHAGGFATAGLSSTPAGVAPGEPWRVDVTVLQHGRTPVDGLTPRVRIRSDDEWRDFAAAPTGKPGVYRAEVVFPSAGRWSYEVLDGFNDQLPHTFAPVHIGGPAVAPAPAARTGAPAETGDGVALGWLIGAGAALVLAAGVMALDRRRRGPEPA